MSRSRKKLAIWKQRNNRWYKKQASKAVRRADIDSGGMFKKVYSSYRICDWKIHEYQHCLNRDWTDEEKEKARRK